MPKYGTSGHVIEDEGTPLAQRPTLNFVGAGVAVTDAGGKSTVTIAGAGAAAFSGARATAAAQNVADDTPLYLVFENPAEYDTDNYYNSGAPDRLTIPDDGYYHVGGFVNFSNLSGAETELQASIVVDDDSSIARHYQIIDAADPNPVWRFSMDTDFVFTEGQFVQLRVNQVGDADGQNVDGRFWIHKLSSGPAGPEGPSGVPVGGIIMWSGTVASIPGDWALCDGTANSPGPDLRDKFIVGATSDDAGVAKTNLTGSLTASGTAAVSAHTLTTNVALSAHTLSTNVAIADHTLGTSQGRTSTASTRAFVTTTGPSHTITQPVVAAHTITQPVVADHTSNWPSYYALAFIQRMS